MMIRNISLMPGHSSLDDFLHVKAAHEWKRSNYRATSNPETANGLTEHQTVMAVPAPRWGKPPLGSRPSSSRATSSPETADGLTEHLSVMAVPSSKWGKPRPGIQT